MDVRARGTVQDDWRGALAGVLYSLVLMGWGVGGTCAQGEAAQL